MLEIGFLPLKQTFLDQVPKDIHENSRGIAAGGKQGASTTSFGTLSRIDQDSNLTELSLLNSDFFPDDPKRART